MSHPAISVVVALYNKADYVRAAVLSALEQVPPVLEVVVVDDGSTDGGGERVAAIGDRRIRLVRQPNGGVSAARNCGVDAARGEFVSFLDADDRYRPGYIEAIVRMIAAFPSAGLYATRYARVWPDGRTEDARAHGVTGTGDVLLDDVFRSWSREPLFFTSSICVRRSIFVNEGIAFPVGERLGEDQDVWFRIAERHDVAYCPEPLAEYTLGVGGSLTGAGTHAGLLPCYRRLADRIEAGVVPRRQRSGARRLVASHWINAARARLATGDRRGALGLLIDRRAVGNLPYWLRTMAMALLLRAGGH